MKSVVKKIIFWKIQFLARLVLKKYKPQIVAVTGSVGKTSAKEAIYRALSTELFVGKSQKTYNTEIGIPLTILGVESGWGSLSRWCRNIIEGLLLLILQNIYPKWLIIEAGIDHPGDMDTIAKMIKTDIVVFTKFAEIPVHVEFFGSPKLVWEEKKKILKTLKDSGTIVLNHDDENVLEIKKGSGKHAITYGFNKMADVVASNLEIFYKNDVPAGISFKVNVDGNSLPIMLEGVLGEQHAYPILSAIAVSKALNINTIKVIDSLKKIEFMPGRMRILNGVYSSTIIDDSYNSSPLAIEKALGVLKEIKETKGRKIAVLGDMLELGSFEENEHRVAGEIAGEFVDVLVSVGERAKNISEGANAAGLNSENIHWFLNSIEAGEFMKDFIREGDLVLVKGSQSLRLEKIIQNILARPEEAKFLLVRQEKEWEKR